MFASASVPLDTPREPSEHRSLRLDRPSVDCPRGSWFGESKEARQTGKVRPGWYLMIDLPDPIAEQHRYHFADGTATDLFCVPWSVTKALPLAWELDD